jgi:hypothetical protein
MREVDIVTGAGVFYIEDDLFNSGKNIVEPNTFLTFKDGEIMLNPIFNLLPKAEYATISIINEILEVENMNMRRDIKLIRENVFEDLFIKKDDVLKSERVYSISESEIDSIKENEAKVSEELNNIKLYEENIIDINIITPFDSLFIDENTVTKEQLLKEYTEEADKIAIDGMINTSKMEEIRKDLLKTLEIEENKRESMENSVNETLSTFISDIVKHNDFINSKIFTHLVNKVLYTKRFAKGNKEDFSRVKATLINAKGLLIHIYLILQHQKSFAYDITFIKIF